MIVRTDGEDSILIDFCSFTRGRVRDGRHPVKAKAVGFVNFTFRGLFNKCDVMWVGGVFVSCV